MRDAPPPAYPLGPANPLFAAGVARFRARLYFEAHEEWERLWASSTGEDRQLLQALIQAAAVGVHLSRGRPLPAGRLAGSAAARLAPLGGARWGLSLDRLREALDALARGAAAPGAEELASLLPPAEPPYSPDGEGTIPAADAAAATTTCASGPRPAAP